MTKEYQPERIELAWQESWDKKKTFEAKEDPSKKKYYILEMFAYPSGKLHMGHVRNYTLGDVISRVKKMQGFNVLHPFGWDAFGLPAEAAALKRKTHPATWTYDNIAMMKKQLIRLGMSYDWSREVTTCSDDYAHQEQKLFIDFYNKGLVYRKESAVNWCESCQTVLANEQVSSGVCWRCENPVTLKPLSQWFFKITNYAQELMEGHKQLEAGWSEHILTMQKNWIGRSEGAEIHFPIDGLVNGKEKKIEVFTTRPDTLWGVTFMSIAPEHPLLFELVKGSKEEKPVLKFIEKVRGEDTRRRSDPTFEKEGLFTGRYVINPVTLEKIPLYVANFVLMEYGTGAVMAVPAHDQRDFEFAKKYKLPIKIVVQNRDSSPSAQNDMQPRHSEPFDAQDRLREESPSHSEPFDAQDRLREESLGHSEPFDAQDRLRDGSPSHSERSKESFGHSERSEESPLDPKELKEAYVGDGKMVDSAQFTGKENRKAIPEILNYLESKNIGKKKIHFRLKDWGISRQRYWGNPIPMIHCQSCGYLPLPIDKLPILLPKDVEFTGSGNPLDKHPTFSKTICYKCGKPARRETDTMDTFVESSWYYLRYAAPHSKDPVDAKASNYWVPVDQYIGGAEHACMHLIYSRFFHKVLRDMGLLKSDEPFLRLLNHGMVLKDGSIMSKSKGNVVDPDEIVEKYGADTLRLFILFAGPPEKELEWNDSAIEGAHRFIKRVWKLVTQYADQITNINPATKPADDKASKSLRRKIHQTIKRVTDDISDKRYQPNTAIAAMMELMNEFSDYKPQTPEEFSIVKEGIEGLLKLLSPFTPHIAEELWSNLGHKELLTEAKWPTFDQALASSDTLTIALQVNGKLRATIEVPIEITEEELKEQALNNPKVKEHVGDRPIKKVIVVPKRLVNIVS